MVYLYVKFIFFFSLSQTQRSDKEQNYQTDENQKDLMHMCVSPLLFYR